MVSYKSRVQNQQHSSMEGKKGDHEPQPLNWGIIDNWQLLRVKELVLIKSAPHSSGWAHTH